MPMGGGQWMALYNMYQEKELLQNKKWEQAAELGEAEVEAAVVETMAEAVIIPVIQEIRKKKQRLLLLIMHKNKEIELDIITK